MSASAAVSHCLDRIERHNKALNALISSLPRDVALSIAKERDNESASGKSKGCLHGVPVLVKDTICSPSIGLPTTCGSFALKDAVAKDDASLVKRLVEQGAIILGKTNITAFGKASRAGWSAVGGQTRSPYILPGSPTGSEFQDHDSPSGSSSGSAVGVAASFAPVAIALETEESTGSPSGRAGIFGLKLTHGSIPMDGIQPYSPFLDCVGIMAQKPSDMIPVLACLNDLSIDSVMELIGLEPSFSNFNFGVVDSALWPVPEGKVTASKLLDQIIQDATVAALAQLTTHGAKVVKNIMLSSYEEVSSGCLNIDQIISRDFATSQEQFLSTFKDGTISIANLEEWIAFNKANAAQELPPEHPSQAGLEALLMPSQQAADQSMAQTRQRAADAIEAALDSQGQSFDALLGPADSRLAAMASLAGYPIACMPLGRWMTGPGHNGRCFGIYALSKPGLAGESTLLRIMIAWEQFVRGFHKPAGLA